MDALDAMWYAYRRSHFKSVESCSICRARAHVAALVLAYRIETADWKSGEGVGAAATTTFGYDYSGQRVFSQTASSTTVFPSKYFSVTSRTVASTTYATSTSYIFAGDTQVAYIEQDLINGSATGTPRTFYVHPDHLGSTNVITTASGTVQSVRDYLPFGSSRINSGDASLRRGYIGEFEEGNNLSYLNARFYQSDRGQFLSQDPVFLALGNPSKVKELLKQEQHELLSDPQQLNSARTMGGSNSGFASGWNGNTQSGGNSISQAEYLADPQMQNSYAYARGNPLRYKDPEGLWYGEVSLEFSPPPPFFLSLSTGFRGDATGVTWFVAGGPSFGAIFPLKAIFSSGNLSHQTEWTVSRSAELFGGAGMGVSTEGAFDPRRPLSTGTNPVSSYYTGAGLGGGVSQQYTFSTPIHTWSSVSNSSRPSGNLDAKSLGIGNTGSGTFTGTYNFGPSIGTYNFGTGSWAK
ncbi:MAG: RHS Repeat family [Parcubacteria group bacterium GW2011_GWA2_51_10]|nr:MAG: RHS Repeat family [Parcubacteria group bacterium GW2011_GWA2_51_10]